MIMNILLSQHILMYFICYFTHILNDTHTMHILMHTHSETFTYASLINMKYYILIGVRKGNNLFRDAGDTVTCKYSLGP